MREITPPQKNNISVWKLIKSDCFRYCSRCKMKDILWSYFTIRSFKYSFWMRIAESNSKIRYVAKFFRRHYSIKYGLQIFGKNIGYGLRIGHACGTIVNPKTIIGNNCTVCQFTTIGESYGKAPIIGDNVYIAPGCNIMGPIRIGSNVLIGAGSVITKDIEDNCVVVGNPGRVIRKTDTPPVTNIWNHITE